MVKKNYFIAIVMIIILAILGFIIATDISVFIANQRSSTSYYSVITNNIYNFTVVAGTYGLNQTNFTLSTGLSFIFGTNGTNAVNSTMINTSSIISCLNDTAGLIAASANRSFWFNLSAADGYYNVTIASLDLYGVVNRTNVSIIVDTLVPAVRITSPSNNTNTSNNALNVNYTISDATAGIQACWYSNDTFAANQTLTSCANITTVTWKEGQHNVTVWANDSAGNVNVSSVTFTTDTVAPNVSIVSPVSYVNYTTSLLLNASANDLTTLVDSVYFNITNITGVQVNFSKASQTGIYWNLTLNIASHPEGVYNITVYANDSLNNINNSQRVTINIDRAPVITLISPANGNNSVVANSNLQFIFNVTDASSIVNCSLTFNGIRVNFNSSVNITGGNNILINSSSYNAINTWMVNCTDLSNNAGNSSTYSFSIPYFSLIGNVYDSSLNAMNNSNVSVALKDMSNNMAHLLIPSTTANASGWFNLSLVTGSGYGYQLVITHKNSTTNAVDYVGQSLPIFPYSEFSALSNVSFYLKQAGTINITVRNNTDNVTATGWAAQVKDTKLGYPVYCEGQSGDSYICNVPKNRNYSIMIYPSSGSNQRFVPVSFNWNNFSSTNSYNISDNTNKANLSYYNSTTSTLHKQFNVTESFASIAGYINGSSIGLSGFVGDFTVVPFLLEPGNMMFMNYGTLPYNISAWNGQRSDNHSLASSYYNITVPYAPAETVNYLFFAAAGNGTGFYGSYRNLTVTGNAYGFNFTMYGLLGSNDAINMSNSTGGIVRINTKRQAFNLVNSTNSTLSSISAHIEMKVDYSSSIAGIPVLTFMEDLSSAGGRFSFPLLNISGFKEMNIYSQTYEPKTVLTRTASQIISNNNITITSFNPSAIGTSVSSSSIGLSAYISNSTCDVPNPSSNCLLTSFTFATAQQNMLPLVVGGGAISLRINYAGVAIHYANVDLLASGPPSADFQTEATTSTSGSFGSLMKFGSSGPTIYDFVLVSIPYTEGSSSATGLNESSQVNMSIPTFYDESYSTPIWSSSNGTDASQLAGNYSHYSTRQAEWQILMNQTTCGTNTSALNRTLPCYINTSDDKIWIRLPHFSGTQPSITGGVITAAVSTSSSGTSGGGSASASETNLAAGYTRQYLAGDATTFKVSGKTHTFIMLYIKNNTAAIQISSSIQKAILSVGEIKKFDVDGDGKYYDLSVKLNSITNNKADITLKSINESMTAAPPVPEAPATAGEKIKETIQQTTAKAKNLGVWLLAIIAAIIVVIIAIIVYYMRKK